MVWYYIQLIFTRLHQDWQSMHREHALSVWALRLWVIVLCRPVPSCVHATAESAWDLLTFHHRKFVISSHCEGYYIQTSSRCLDFNCPLALISLITTVRHLLFSLSEEQRRETDDTGSHKPTCLISASVFPLFKLNAKYDLLWLPFPKALVELSSVGEVRVVFMYGLHHVDCMWFSCWVKI